MQIGMIGLGRMGGNLVAAEGALGANPLEDFVSKLAKPRTAWVMLPAGKITEATIDALTRLMESGDVKRTATHVTASNENEGFARAIDVILSRNRAG
jgi:6-phosphogluconate dehydrogenase (decarboxylating)